VLYEPNVDIDGQLNEFKSTLNNALFKGLGKRYVHRLIQPLETLITNSRLKRWSI